MGDQANLVYQVAKVLKGERLAYVNYIVNAAPSSYDEATRYGIELYIFSISASTLPYDWITNNSIYLAGPYFL